MMLKSDGSEGHWKIRISIDNIKLVPFACFCLLMKKMVLISRRSIYPLRCYRGDIFRVRFAARNDEHVFINATCTPGGKSNNFITVADDNTGTKIYSYWFRATGSCLFQNMFCKKYVVLSYT